MKWFHLFYRKLTPVVLYRIILELKENWEPRDREIVALTQTREVEILNCPIWPEQWTSEGKNWEGKLEHLVRRGSIMKSLKMGNRQVNLEWTRRWMECFIVMDASFHHCDFLQWNHSQVQIAYILYLVSAPCHLCVLGHIFFLLSLWPR